MMMSKSAIFFAACIALVSIGFSNAITPNSCRVNPTTFGPNATSCANVRDSASCDALFPPGAAATDRATGCENPLLETFALECANTCRLCCETAAYTCGDSIASPINCTANTRYCTDPAWTNVMQTYCPGTCGLCTSVNATCRDVLTGCAGMRTLCFDINFNAYMTTNCRRTCNFCPTSTVTTTASTGTGTCSDVATNCAANIGLCNNAAYLTLMTQKCPRTCNRCSSSVVTSTCANTNANCATWVANGFCTNTFYTAAQRRSFCGASCGLC